MSLVLSAFMAGKSVYIEGKGVSSCNVYSDIEELNAILVN